MAPTTVFPRVPGVVFVGLSLTACDGSDAPRSTYTVRDSARVTIVESTAPEWREGDAWAVSPEPTLHIGVIEGPEEVQFTIVAGVFERDGQIVVGDASGEVRSYEASTGSFLGSFGRQGEGPGEFRRLTATHPYPGDSILTWDFPGRRVSVFDRGGVFARSSTPTFPPPPEPRGTGSVAYRTAGGIGNVLTDGTLLGRAAVMYEGEPGERVLTADYFVRYSAQGDSLESFGPFRSTSVITDFTRQPRLADPYPEIVLVTPREGGLYVGEGNRFQISDISFDSGLERVIRTSHLDLRLTEVHEETYRDSESERLADAVDPGALERALLEAVFPETIPPYSQLLVDSEHHLWVRHFSTRWTAGPERWSVFSPEGFLLGLVDTPERLQVRQIGPDFLLGIWTDDLDVRYIRKYGLAR